MKISFRRLSISVLTLLGLLFSVSGVTSAHAVGAVVSNTNNSGAGSLRQAIADAGVGDTITFAAGLSGGTINLASTLILSKNVTINGSALAQPITISGDTAPANGSADVRVFRVSSGVTATLNGLVITKGTIVDNGGGIYNGGTLTVTNSTITDNYASLNGAGIFNNNGTLTITNSTITNNSAGGGGGILNNGGSLTVTNSTISGNSADFGGGIFNNSGTLTVTHSTISDNSAINIGGGIENYSTLIVTNSTLSGNTGTYGGGLRNGMAATATIARSTISGNSVSHEGGGIQNNGQLTITNSTISGNSAVEDSGGILNFDKLTIRNSTIAANSAPLAGGIWNYNTNGTLSYSNTIIANSTGGGDDCVNNGNLNININNLVQVGSCSATFSGNPKLGLLANNGGPTKTIALLTGSPAIDAGNDAICAAAPVNGIDQRGVARPAGAHCDIGAYEGEIAPSILTLKSVAAQDGWVLESSESSSVGGSMYSVGPTLAIGDNAAKQEYRSVLSFNTSSLPDTAVIVGVTLKVKKQAIVGGGDPITAFQGLLVGMSKGTIGAAALEVSDFQTSTGTLTPLGPFMPVPVNDWYSLDLSNGGKAYINKLTSNSGLTQIRLRFKLDDNNDAVANYLSLYSGDAVNAADRPQLVITYLLP